MVPPQTFPLTEVRGHNENMPKAFFQCEKEQKHYSDFVTFVSRGLCLVHTDQNPDHKTLMVND